MPEKTGEMPDSGYASIKESVVDITYEATLSDSVYYCLIIS